MAWRRRSRFGVGLGLLAALVAVPAVAIGRIHGFDGLYGQDAFGYADYGLGPLRAAILAGRLPPDFPLPPGYPILVALASLVGGPSDGVALGLSLACGALTPVLVALLAREIWPETAWWLAVLAGLVAAVTGQLWQSSLVAMPDTPALAAATLGAIAGLRYDRTGRTRWAVAAAAFLALAVEVRLVYGAVAVVVAALVVARLRREIRPEPRRSAGTLAGATLAGAAVLAPMLVPMLLAASRGEPAPFSVELGVAPLDPLTPFRSSFETADGHLVYDLPMFAWLLLQPIQPYWLGLLGLAVPVGLAASFRRRAHSTPETAMLVAWLAVVAVVLALYPYQNPRFVLALLPPLAIFAACGLAWLWARLETRPRAGQTFALIMGAAIVANAGLAWRHADDFTVRQSADLEAIRHLAAAVPTNATVISLGATPALRHAGHDVVELFDLAPREADALTAAGPTWLIVEVPALETQWRDATPGKTFAHILASPGLVELDRAGSWTLFRTP